MRNQKRKMFPDLMLSFKKYLEKAPKDIAEKSFLYLHTSFPEKSGWDITSVIHELGLGSKVLVTYVCRHCKKYFVSNFRDAICQCDYCKNISATMPGVQNGIEHSELHKIYNLMDLYIQYAICEGFGMPQVEAAACGTPIASIDYSAMEDVVRYCNGYPIKPHLQREMETNADRSSHNNDHLVEIMLSFASQSEPEIKKQRLQTRKGCITRYNWDRTAKVWEDYFDSIKNFKESHGKWDEPPKVKEFPKELPKDMSHGQFCELMFTQVIQDPKEMFGYKMLSMLRNLNFGADIERGLESCSQESVFKENMGLAERRLFFDKLRTKQIGVNTPSFIAEAHRRLKK